MAVNWDDLIDSSLISPIYVDELGGRPSIDPSTLAWTGTEWDGTVNLTGDCNGWTSDVGGVMGLIGETDFTSGVWSAVEPGGCNLEAHLYCFEQ